MNDAIIALKFSAEEVGDGDRLGRGRQRRVGLDGEEFEMLKLRTMVEGSDLVHTELGTNTSYTWKLNGGDYEAARALFLAGKAAMLIDGDAHLACLTLAECQPGKRPARCRAWPT